MKKYIPLIVGAALISGVPITQAHNTMTAYYAPAGFMQDLELRVTHGCKGSPVKEVRLKIPDGMMREIGRAHV